MSYKFNLTAYINKERRTKSAGYEDRINDALEFHHYAKDKPLLLQYLYQNPNAAKDIKEHINKTGLSLSLYETVDKTRNKRLVELASAGPYFKSEDYKDLEAMCDIILNKGYLKVNEVTYKQLIQITRNEDPNRVEKAKPLITRYMGLNQHGDLMFRTTSDSKPGHYYYQTVRLLDLQQAIDLFKGEGEIKDRDIVDLAVAGDIAIHCNDPSFKFWGWQYMATALGHAIQAEPRAPKINNTKLKGALCKHLYNALMVMPFHVTSIVKDLRARFFILSQEERDKKRQAELEPDTTQQDVKYDQDPTQKLRRFDKAIDKDLDIEDMDYISDEDLIYDEEEKRHERN